MSALKAYYVGKSDVYAAYDAEDALYCANENSGGDPVYSIDEVRELKDSDLDFTFPEFDDNWELTGNKTSIRNWLHDTSEPGYLCGEDW